MTLTISELFIYPVKSLGAVALDSVTVHATGLDKDRQWMVVDATNKFVTQRQIPKMATIQVRLEDNNLILSHHETGQLVVPVDAETDKPEHFQIWKDTIEGYCVSANATEWLTKTLGSFRGGSLRLVNFNNQSQRIVAEKYLAKQDAALKLADACPFLLTFEESLQQLNTALQKEMPMDRFRANIVFKGASAFEEYRWSNLKNSQLNFGLIGPCQRCPMTSVDQQKGVVVTPGQPLQTLMQHFAVGEKNLPYFGQHARLLEGSGGIISIGDQFDTTMN